MRRIFRSGNSLVVALPAEVLSRFKLKEGSGVSVEVDEEHGGILVSPAEPELAGVDAEFGRQLDAFIERYRPALERLADE